MTNDIKQYAERMGRHVKAAVNAGDLRTARQRLEAALRHFETRGKAAVGPFRKTLEVLAMVQREMCQLEAAAESLNRAIALVENKAQADVIRLRRILLLPPMMVSPEAIEAARSRYARGLEGVDTSNLTITNPMLDLPMLHFYLVYHGLDDRPIMELQARVLRSVCPSLNAPLLEPSVFTERPRRDRLRIGFLSTNFRNHTIGKLNAGLITALPVEIFEKVLFLDESQADAFSEQMAQTADRCVRLPRDLQKAYAAIVGQRLDVLYFADLGMDNLTYFLAFYRMAPVQVSTWGHPVTSGLPTIDGFVLAADMEPENGDRHFSEGLIRLSSPNFFYSRPKLPEPPQDRQFFGLPEDAHLYLCPQAVYKFHPAFDPVLTEILRRDPKGCLVITRSKYRAWDEILQNRLMALFQGARQQVVWLKRMPRSHYLSLLALGDVMLDPFPFCGGNTSLEALSFGTPVVTYPTQHIRGRLTYTFYRTMGMMDCVADSADAYIELAVRLGTDGGARQKLHEKILSRCACLYENPSFVDSLSEALMKMSRSGTQT